MKKIILGGSRVGKTVRLEPKDSPLMEVIRRSALHGVRRKAPEWLDDELAPVDIGPYRVIGYIEDKDGVPHMMIRDTRDGSVIEMIGKVVEDGRV